MPTVNTIAAAKSARDSEQAVGASARTPAAVVARPIPGSGKLGSLGNATQETKTQWVATMAICDFEAEAGSFRPAESGATGVAFGLGGASAHARITLGSSPQNAPLSRFVRRYCRQSRAAEIPVRSSLSRRLDRFLGNWVRSVMIRNRLLFRDLEKIIPPWSRVEWRAVDDLAGGR